MFLFLPISISSTAQVLINDTDSSNENPHPSAILELRSKNKGFLPPRLTKNQRQNIQIPTEGLIIYLIDVNDQCLQIYNGIRWDNIYCPTNNNPPKAENVNISGRPTVDAVLQGNYIYGDTENDPQGNSIYNWYIADDIQGNNTTSLNNNTISYTIKSEDLEKYITFSVTPYAISGAEIGKTHYSNYIGPITQSVSPPTNISNININEFHYENIKNDTKEFVEVRVSQNNTPIDIDNYQIVLYNGSKGEKYRSITLNQLTKNCDNDYCYYVWDVPSSLGIQNGNPGGDGIALVNGLNSVIEFISYEGVFTATNGLAKGAISKDIGIKQSNSSTPENSSIYLDKDNKWKLSEGSNTKGTSNF